MGMKIGPKISALRPIFESEEEAIKYLDIKGVLYTPSSCLGCGADLSRTSLKLLRCTAPQCRRSFTVLKDSIFEDCKIGVNRILELSHKWLARSPMICTYKQCDYSMKTVSLWYDKFLDILSNDFDYIETKIGGENIIVELDEAKFGKNKHHRGHPVPGVWVFGGVERTRERHLFLVEVKDRSAKTLMEAIKEYVLPGSILYTDCWKGYSKIEAELNMTHLTVNHSIYFKDPESGVHTNTIEGTWSGVKPKIPYRNRSTGKIMKELLRVIWERKNEGNLWEKYMECLKNHSIE